MLLATHLRLLILGTLLVGSLLVACQEENPAADELHHVADGDQPTSSPIDNEQELVTPADQPLQRNDTCLFGRLRGRLRQAREMISSQLQNARQNLHEVRDHAFQHFMQLYNRTYTAEELPKRMALFMKRRDEIRESVRQFLDGKLPFAMKENPFVDWSDEELKKLTGVSMPSANELLPGERPEVSRRRLTRSLPGNESMEIEAEDEEEDIGLNVGAPESIPASKDWQTSGCVLAPINQLKCGACYAIATMSVVESMRCIQQETGPALSPQQIVDCATARNGYKNYGCDGGWPTRVLQYLQDTGVAARESCYPFQWRQNSCKLNQVQRQQGCTVSASPSNSRRIQYKVLHNERDILYHVAKTGPVVTVMKASDKFLYYGQGIFDDPRCSNRRDDVDHAIVITGYGRENGVDYWIIKNSWGVKEWGIDGYAKYRRGKNACSIGHWGWVVTG